MQRQSVLRAASGIRQSFRSQPAKRWQSTLPSEHHSNDRNLTQVLQKHIKAHGPLPLPQYINLCLTHPTFGYYSRQREENAGTVIGKQGDFVTSPEISQIFGELLAIWYVTQWQAQGCPNNVRIVELGPGQGTLIEDMLRTFDAIAEFSSAIKEIHLVETSAYLKQVQERKLKSFAKSKDIKLHWHNRVEDVPLAEDGFTIALAHEFFDALPIHLFEKRPEGWREVFIDSQQTSAAESPLLIKAGKPDFRFAISPSPTLASQLYANHPRLKDLSTGTRVEVSSEGYGFATSFSKLVAGKTGGAGLIIDYGDAKFFGSSFRGFKQHQIVDPLIEPGNVDLTANVDFEWLTDAMQDTAKVHGPVTQRSFLLNMGLGIRLEKLLEAAKEDRAQELIKGAERLVDNSKVGMGMQYRVMGVTPKGNEGDVYPFKHEFD